MKKIIEIESTNRRYHKCIVCGIKSELQIMAIGHDSQDDQEEGLIKEIVICEECLYNLAKVIEDRSGEYISNSKINKMIMEVDVEKLVSYIKVTYRVELAEVVEGRIYVGNKLQGRYLSCEEKREILKEYKRILKEYKNR